jgi:hypothetical protein
MTHTVERPEENNGAIQAASSAPTRERLRFTSFTFKRIPSGVATAEVMLEWADGEVYRGRADGVSSALGDLRIAADATLRAMSEFSRGADVTFEIGGVKALRAFDANVVIVSVLTRREGKEQRLLGCHLAEEDSLRSAVLATLQATNRLLGVITRVE